MAIRERRTNILKTYKVDIDTPFHSGCVMAINKKTQIIHIADRAKDKGESIVGYAGSSNSNTNNFRIEIDPVGNMYCDKDGNFTISPYAYYLARIMSSDFDENRFPVYPVHNRFITDQYVNSIISSAHEDCQMHSGYKFRKGDYLTYRAGENAGKLVAVSKGMIDKVFIVGKVEYFDYFNTLLFVTQECVVLDTHGNFIIEDEE